MEVKAEYKQSEVGVIPEDWEICTIQSLIDQNVIIGHLDGNHGAFYPRSHEFKNFGIPYITANDFCGRKVSFDKCKYLSLERARQFKKGVAMDGDVLFAHNATVGPTALLFTDYQYVILSTTATYFRCHNERLINSFLLYMLQSTLFVGQYQGVMAQSTRNQVPITAQRKLYIAIPPCLTEQQAIAEALSDADALIESLEQLIVKKRQVKQGAMQDLLTGKRRLPGFEGEWEVRRLDEIAEIRSGGTPSTTQSKFWDGGIPWCTPTDITSLKGHKYLRRTNRTISKLGLNNSSAEIIPINSIVMTTRATIGECAINLVSMTTNQGFKNLIPIDKVSAEFLYYLLLTKKNEIIGLSSGSTFLEISKSQLSKFEVRLPIKTEEQLAIADTLGDIDSEIDVLESKLNKARQVKQGMMQELLTGRIRLIG